MSKKRENLFERYIDKAVLGVAGLLSLWLLWVFVLASPYSTKIDGRKIGSGQIDEYIRDQWVEQLLRKLEEHPKPKVYDKTRKKAPRFAKMIECSINHIDENVCVPIPGYGDNVAVDSRIYTLPEIGELGDVAIEHYRTVVYKPLEPVDLANPYSTVPTDLGDIDLVTVQASFDAASLYRNFEQSFSGRLVRRNWQDKNLAKPVFAAVQLQRRRKLYDGSFSKWEVVGRTKVDDLKNMLESIPENIDDKYTINLLMVKFDKFDIRKGILQPATYEFAATNNDWLPPGLHKEYMKLMKEEQDKLRRERLYGRGTSNLLDEEDTGRMGAIGSRGRRTAAPGSRGRAGTTGRGIDRSRRSTRSGATGRYGSRLPGDERGKEKKKERKVSDVFEDFKKILMTEKNTIDKMREPLIFWAHDDTVVPGASYQYRIRLGVFNPIAGRDWFRENQKDYKDKPILWSGYSKETEVVDIPLMMHFFPLDVVAKEEKAVKIKVAKFHNGKWRSEDFQVRPGEMIGRVVERKPAEEKLWSGSYGGRRADEAENEVELIDFSTGASLVDVVYTSDWTGVNRLQQRDYADILYCKDDNDTVIDHLAVKYRNWPQDLQQQFAKVNAAKSEKIQLRERGRSDFYQPASSTDDILLDTF
ncbi:MAG: hypothetical protein DRP65_00365 [Planctomycetota bacterium]|nr:MAG: hypothetical protein DRP65_00365 [Planctomycetota bacterium]